MNRSSDSIERGIWNHSKEGMGQTNRARIEYLLHQLEASGKRATPQRYAVCQALVEQGGHPTVADVFERVRETFPMISQATVYNTIDTLKELGLVHQLEIANDEHTHYDLDLQPHINLVCTECGDIRDVHSHTIDALLAEVQRSSGYQLSQRNALVVYGVCPDCQRQACPARRNAAVGAVGHTYPPDADGDASATNSQTNVALNNLR